MTSFTKVSIENNNVILATFQKPAKTLYQVADQKFMAEGKTTISHVFYTNDENGLCISDGFSSLRKIDGLVILLYWISFFLGSISLIYILVSGIVQSFIFKIKIFSKPIAWVFLTILFLLLSSSLLFLQTFVTLGDVTPGSMMLAISTILLPLGLLLSAWHHFKDRQFSFYSKMDFVAVVFSLQFILVLAFWGLIPFRLWV